MRESQSGSEYLASLRDGRQVILSGRLVEDVTSDPATRAMAHYLAALLDTDGDGSGKSGGGDAIGTAYGRALSHADLIERGRAFERIARVGGGLLGRSPDFLATILTAWANSASYFGQFHHNVVNYWEACRTGNRVLTHAISDPPANRALPGGAADLAQTLHVVRSTADGLIVRGSKMLATLAPFAQDLLVYPYRPLAPVEADLALCFAIPAAAPGLRLYCRPALSRGAAEDCPLASRFDEMDAICVFDDVLVPWDRIFIDRDVQAANGLRAGTRMTAYAWHQSSIRSWVKAEFIFEVAAGCARVSNRVGNPAVQQQLGELAGIVELLRSLVIAGETGAHQDGSGNYLCDETPLACSAMVNSQLNPRAVELLQLIGSSGLIVHPSVADDSLSSPAHDFYDVYFAGNGADASAHAALLRVAAELALDRFGGRQTLYERVFVGPPEAFRRKFFDLYTRTRLGEPMLGNLLSAGISAGPAGLPGAFP